MRNLIFVGSALLLSVPVLLVGCGKSVSPGNAPKPEPAQGETDAASQYHGSSTKQSTQAPEVTAALAKLPAEDRELALKQKVCPVSGEPLGSMGTPLKIDVNGRPVFICCEGCKEELLAKPDEYLAKINKS